MEATALGMLEWDHSKLVTHLWTRVCCLYNMLLVLAILVLALAIATALCSPRQQCLAVVLL